MQCTNCRVLVLPCWKPPGGNPGPEGACWNPGAIIGGAAVKNHVEWSLYFRILSDLYFLEEPWERRSGRRVQVRWEKTAVLEMEPHWGSQHHSAQAAQVRMAQLKQ